MNNYIRTSKIERIALKSIIPLLFNKDKITFYTTSEEGTDIYDAYVMKMNENFSIIGRYIIECKVRDTFYPNLLLEKKKYDDLKQKALESDARMIYICVTPEGAFCFNLDKLINNETKWSREEHWKSTQDKSLGKIMKKVYYINTDLGKKIPYTSKICQSELENEIKSINVISEVKEKVDYLYEYLTKNN